MTIEQALELENHWASKGNPPCPHATFELLLTEATGYLTGAYACVECGKQIAIQDWNNPSLKSIL